MKIKSFLFGMFATVALAACTSEDAVNASGGDGTVSDGTPRYMCVNIMDVNTGSGTNKDIDETASRAGSRANFEVGTDDENNVSSVRFYFFYEDGSAAPVKYVASSKSYVNYLDWSSTDIEDGNTNTGDVNVEKTLKANLVINTEEGDKLPTKMLAILNGKPSATGSLSLSNLRSETGDYKALADAGTFVMVNSVYAKNNERMSCTDISSDKIIKKATGETSEQTIAKAKENPVDVYVERNVAKVQVSNNVTATQASVGGSSVEIYPLVTKSTTGTETTYEYLTIEGEQYFFLPQGWDLTATTNKVYLSKHINPHWNLANFNGWNDSDNYRSYWAENVLSGDNDESGQVYNETFETVGTKFGNSVYANENAATTTSGSARTYPTQVIVAGQLVKKKSDDTYEIATLGHYEGAYFTEDGLLEEMYKKLSLYTDVTGEETERPVLNIKCLMFASATATALKRDSKATVSGQTSSPRCYVELALNGTCDTDGYWTLSDGSNTYKTKLYSGSGTAETALTEAQVLAALNEAGQALLYKNGQTYYWFKVPHLATKDVGEYGVVRNHSYKCNISHIVGLGTPVFDNKETIYPETPVDVESYIAAKINILSWKLVEKNIDLGE